MLNIHNVYIFRLLLIDNFPIRDYTPMGLIRETETGEAFELATRHTVKAHEAFELL